MNVLLIAEESAGMHALRTVARNGHRIVAVLTSGRNPLPRGGSVRELAQHMGIAAWPATLARDPAFAPRVRADGVELLINVQSLVEVDAQVLGAASLGGFNLHPGPLPEYAGLSVISWALYNGAEKYGATLHRIAGSIHKGPVAYESRFEIEPSDSALTLTARCVNAGMPLLERLLQDAATDSVPALDIGADDVTLYGSEPPQHGCLRWNRPASAVVNFVRACDYLPFKSPWGHPQACVRDVEFQVVKAARMEDHCSATPPGTVGWLVGRGVSVACEDEWVLVNRVAIDGRHFEAADLLRPGDQVEDGGRIVSAIAATLN